MHPSDPLSPSSIQLKLFITNHGINKGKVKGIRVMGTFLLKWKKWWLGKF
jgi:hypothetical protein